MNEDELSCLARRAWSQVDSMKILLDYLLSNNIVSDIYYHDPLNRCEANANSHNEESNRLYAIWTLESQIRRWILERFNYKFQTMYYPLSMESESTDLYEIIYCRYIFLVCNVDTLKEPLFDPFGVGPVPFLLVDEHSPQFEKYLRPLFNKIEYGKTTFNDFLMAFYRSKKI